ncbi:MAG: metallophosphoesterase [Candidatus Thorarchaeota archaeon]
MTTNNTNEKRVIIKKLAKSGINITPSLLEFILELEDPIYKVNLIIKDSSFIASFRGHLTEAILKKISNEEIKKALKRKLILSQDRSKNNEFTLKDEILQSQSPTGNQNKLVDVDLNLSEESENLAVGIKNDGNQVLSSPTVNNDNPPFNLEFSDKSQLKPFEGVKSTYSFNPIAKEFDFQLEVLKDPTGKLYTNGDYDDFYELTLDKFNRLRKLMRKRAEVHKADNINNILRLSNKVEVSALGLVNEIRKTKKGNYLLTLEDLTGSIKVIIRQDSDNQDNVKLAERTLSDQMVYIEGTYNPGEKKRPGIMYGNFITKIDIPRDYEPNKAEDPLSIALISDTHIGSKEFELKLWNRFIEFLNGKIGNQAQRDRAGRIKYIIINGDLVDGIGVYPSQKSDLLETNIYKQFNNAAELISEIPDYIKVIYSPGNHEPVRNAIPRPAVPKKYCEELINLGVKCIGNPGIIQTHKVNTLVFHGDSILDLNMLVPGLENSKSVETMKEFLKCRHLAPIFGKKTQISPTNKDWLVIDKIPDIFHTGHIHINDMGLYNNSIVLVNSGCFQSQTEFMNSLGIHPTPGILSIVDLDTLKGTQLDLKYTIL